MNAITQTTLPRLGARMPGGFFAGAYLLNGQRRALIVSTKKIGISLKGVWHEEEIDVPGAKSYNDGMANTLAMAAAGSGLARTTLELEIDGLKDFYIPSQDELEICYRVFKPTIESNWCYARSGINLSALPPTYPYAPDFPVQTMLETFKVGGDEAFEEDWYWTSTQHAGDSVIAWCQIFNYGYQLNGIKSCECRVRPVRSQPI
jgi:hypothetical protein